ncbi:hypothetical protein vseg_016175 [Gypsophila vaccaria]
MAQQISNDAEPTKPFLLLHMSSVEKLTGPNFQQWRAQIESLLLGYGLHGYLVGSVEPPSATLITHKTDSDINSGDIAESPNPAYLTWFRQYKLVYGALATTLGSSIGTLIIRCTTAKEAWDAILAAYAKPSRGHLKVLRHGHKNLTKGTTPIHTYMSQIKAIMDELAMLGNSVKDEDLQDYILARVADPRYNGFIESVQFGRDTIMPYPKLLEKLINLEHLHDTAAPSHSRIYQTTANPTSSRGSHCHQLYTRQTGAQSNQNPRNPFKGKCQWCNVVGHILSYCLTFKDLYPNITGPRYSCSHTTTGHSTSHNSTTMAQPQANTTSTIPRAIVPASWPLDPSQHIPTSSWLLDSGASHHVTMDHQNLAAHFPYDSTDEIVIGSSHGKNSPTRSNK